MRRLMLLRHAKSSWDQSDLGDVDRPLAPRGQAAAPLIGRAMNQKRLWPDLVLCSSAARARQTWDLVAAEWDRGEGSGRPRVDIRPSLYLATAADLLSIIRRVDDDVGGVMVVGHNPGLGLLATRLAGGGGDTAAAQAMARKFPTGALAIIDFDVQAWDSLRPGQGRLAAFMRPKALKP